MKQKLSQVAVSAARYLKKNGGQFEVEMSDTQRVNITPLLSVLGEFESCKYLTKKIDDGRFAIIRIHC